MQQLISLKKLFEMRKSTVQKANNKERTAIGLFPFDRMSSKSAEETK